MESLKEIFDALSQRIKSPIFGYIILAFIAINWKPLYYLFFSGKPALMKFNFFEENTDTWSLYLWPLGFGLIAALTAPHISNWGAWWAIKPINAMRKREVKAAHEVLQEKNQLAVERDNEKAIYEQSLIDEAKRDQEISEIEDEEIRQNLEQKVKSSRTEYIEDENNGSLSSSNKEQMFIFDSLSDEISGEAGKLLKLLNSHTKGRMTVIYINKKIEEIIIGSETINVAKNRKLGIRYITALKFLGKENLIVLDVEKNMEKGFVVYLITSLGYDFADFLVEKDNRQGY